MNVPTVPAFIANVIDQFQERQLRAICPHEVHNRVIIKRYEGNIEVMCKNCGATL